MTKSRLAASMNQAELENYSQLHTTAEAGIMEAKGIRKNRMEYDALAKVIMTHPDRETSEARIEELKLEQKSLEEKEIKLDKKLDIRKKQFHVLVSSIHQMQDLLANDEDNCKTEDISKDSNLSQASDDSDIE